MKPQQLVMENGCKIIVRTVFESTKGVPIVFWGGIFGTHLIWGPLVKRLRSSHPIIIIDYPNGHLNWSLFQHDRLRMSMLATFQQEIMNQFNFSNAVTVGWSFGTQVALQFVKQHGSQTAAIIAMSGVTGKAFKHISDPIFETIGIRPTFSQTVGWLSQKEEALGRLRKILRKNEHPSRWAKRLGLVGPSVDDLVMDAIIRDFAQMTPSHYNQYLQVAAHHDAKSALTDSNIPVLAISGSLDKLVPSKRTREFVNKRQSAEFLLVKGGTHFLPLEYPELIALTIEEFLKKNRI